MGDTSSAYIPKELTEEEKALLRPKLYWFNIIMIVAMIGLLVSGIFKPEVIFIVGFCISLFVNFPKPKDQAKVINSHAEAALLMVCLLFAASVFSNILKETGMITAMAEFLIKLIPVSAGRFIPLIVGISGVMLSVCCLTADAIYYGLLPVVAETAKAFGIPAVSVARAFLCGGATIGFPLNAAVAATIVLLSVTGIDLGDHLKSTVPKAYIVSMVILVVSIITGAVTM